MFVRFQSPYPGKRGVYTGVFGLTNLLARSGRLTAEEHADWRSGNDWYNREYPDPTDTDPQVYDETVNPRSTAWFKATAVHLIERVERYLDILRAHDIECERVESDDPGRVIYEDDFQVVVTPHDPLATTSFRPQQATE